MDALVTWPDVVQATVGFLEVELAEAFDGLEVAGRRPGADLDAPHLPFLQVELDNTNEVFPVSRENLLRLTAWAIDEDAARDLAEAARGVVMALTQTVHPVLRVVANDNGGAPLDAVDQVSDQRVCSVLVRIHTRPLGV